MRFIIFWLSIIFFFIYGIGCSLISDFGDYTLNNEEEEIPVDRSPGTIVQTTGSGTCSSSDYKLHISLGMPQPMGNASSDDYHIKVGPNTTVK